MLRFQDLENLSIKVNDGKKIDNKTNPSLDLVIFLRRPFVEWATEFTHIYQAFLNKFSNQFTFLWDGSKWKKATEKQLKKPLGWEKDEKKLNANLFGLNIHSGEDVEDASWRPPKAPALDFCQDQVHKKDISAYLQLSFPPEEHDFLLEFVQKELIHLPLHSGYVGYSVLCHRSSPFDTHWSDQFAELLHLYPGLNYPDVGRVGGWAGEDLLVVSWMTFLGEGLLQKLGGPKKVEKEIRQLSKSFLVHPSGNSLYVQIGKEPELGEKIPSSLPLYKKLGHYLHSLLPSDKIIAGIGVGGMRNIKEEVVWWKRFFE